MIPFFLSLCSGWFICFCPLLPIKCFFLMKNTRFNINNSGKNPKRDREKGKKTPQMTQIQASLAVFVLSATGNIASLRELLNLHSLDPKIVFKSLLFLTPTFTNPAEFIFMKEYLAGQPTVKESNIAEFIAENEELQSLLQLEDPKVLYERFDVINKFLGDRFKQYDERYTFVNFLKIRTTLNLHITNDLHFNDALFNIMSDDEGFLNWYHSNITPLEYIAKYQPKSWIISLEWWGSLSRTEQLHQIFELLTSNGVVSVESQFQLFLNTVKDSEVLEFVQSVNVNTVPKLQLLNKVTLQVPSNPELVDAIISRNYAFAQLDKTSLDSINELISKLSTDKTQRLQELATSAGILNFENKSLAELDVISKDETQQTELYKTVLSTINISKPQGYVTALQSLHATTFPLIPLSKFQSLLIHRLLSLRLFSLINSQDEKIIIDHFWKYFKSATNGFKNRGELQNGLQLLNLIQQPSEEIQKLKDLVEAVDSLSKFKLFFQNGIPFKPADLLSQPLTTVLQRVLELNKEAYEHHESLYNIFRAISIGLSLEEIPKFDIQKASIESSLAFDDFDFAVTLSLELLKSSKLDDLTESWLTFYQVGKFLSLKWLEDSTPVNVLELKLELLAKLLKIVPLNSSHLVIELWNQVEIELDLAKGSETTN